MIQRTRHALPWLGHFALALAALLACGSVAAFALHPPTKEDLKSEPQSVYTTKLFLNGQLALIAIWSALGSAPWYARWGGAAVTFVVMSRATQAADPVISLYFYQPWELNTAALLTFTLLTALRALGLHLSTANSACDAAAAIWQFSLRRMFVWVAMVAALSCAWKYCLAVEAQRKLNWPVFPINVWRLTVSAAVTDALIALVAVFATLRRKPLRWWMLMFLPLVVLLQTAIMELTFQAMERRAATAWYNSYMYYSRGDLTQIAPLVGVLLLARAAGYRLAWGGNKNDPQGVI